MGDKLAAMVQSGEVSMDKIDDSAVRNMWPYFAVGLFDKENNNTKDNNVTTPEHNKLARDLASASTVLLKNDGALPISGAKNIVVIGDEAMNPIVHGGGSGRVEPYYVVSPLDGVRAHLGIAPAPPPLNNCSGGIFEQDIDYYNFDQQASAPASSVDECCALCAARGSCHAFTWAGSTCWMKGTANGRRSKPGAQSGVCQKTPWHGKDCNHDGVCVSYYTSSVEDVSSAVAGADVVLVFVATTSAENHDRANLTLGSQDVLIQRVATEAKQRTVVVAVTPAALLTPWREHVGAIITPFTPGQEYGNAIADVLFGDVNPSARLPLTFPNSENDINMTQEMYPGKNGISVYSEGLEVGYRWYNAHDVAPAFPFGHGLSYTPFLYSGLKVQGRTVSCSVKNTGDVDGAEVPQLYLGFPASAQEPPKQLKGFQKVMLKAGDSATVTFELADRDLSIWDVSSSQWSVVAGDFDIMVGASSEDIRLTGTLASLALVTV